MNTDSGTEPFATASARVHAPPAVVSQVRVVVGTLAEQAELHGAAVLVRRNLSGHDPLSRPAQTTA